MINELKIISMIYERVEKAKGTEASIECEAPMEGAKNILRFKDKRLFKKHAELYCTRNYRYCEVHRMVMAAKYED